MKFFIFLFTLIFKIREYSSQGIYDKPVPQVIEYYGYPSETHSVYTEDGYNLILHRIPYGRRCKIENSPVVVLQHGIFQSSLVWLYLGPKNSLGFLLADNCYDVWLANSRGNCYSRKHIYLTKYKAKYWDFSYHEMGVFDISATVDYAIKATKNQKPVFFIGVSEGSTAGIVNAIKRSDTKIKGYFFLAPVSYSTNSLSPARFLSRIEPYLTHLTQKYGTFPVGFNVQPAKLWEKIICRIAPDLCGLPFAFCGYDPGHLNKTGLYAQLVQSCAVSVKQLLHYLQGFRLALSEYDYGTSKNKEKYNTSSPPKYRVEVINKPVYLYHARKDLCGDKEDVFRLVEELGNNLARNYLVDDSAFGHLSFSLNVRVKELVFDPLMSDLRKASYEFRKINYKST